MTHPFLPFYPLLLLGADIFCKPLTNKFSLENKGKFGSIFPIRNDKYNRDACFFKLHCCRCFLILSDTELH